MSSDGFLHRYFLNNSGRLIHKWIHYFDIYERHLARFCNKPTVMLEIGVSRGGSLQMWKNYLGPQSKIIGIDINPTCKNYEEDRVEIFIGSQDDPNLIANIKEKYPHIDVVLDDGSHMMPHMIKSFELLYDFVDPHGVYIVEDTHTCYSPKFKGGLKSEGSFIEFAKNRIDDLSATFTKGTLPMTTFTKSTDSVCFYDSMVVFERRPQGMRQTPQTQPMTDQRNLE